MTDTSAGLKPSSVFTSSNTSDLEEVFTKKLQDYTPEDREKEIDEDEKKRAFEAKRKAHYNEFLLLKAKAAQEDEEEEEEASAKHAKA